MPTCEDDEVDCPLPDAPQQAIADAKTWLLEQWRKADVDPDLSDQQKRC
jgi:hypothetical protein